MGAMANMTKAVDSATLIGEIQQGDGRYTRYFAVEAATGRAAMECDGLPRLREQHPSGESEWGVWSLDADWRGGNLWLVTASYFPRCVEIVNGDVIADGVRVVNCNGTWKAEGEK